MDIKTPKTRLAYVISRVLGPLPLICLIWLIASLKSGLGLSRVLWVYPLIFITSDAITIGITDYLIATKKVKNIEWSDVKDRKKYLLPISIFSFTFLIGSTYAFTNSTIFHLSLLLCAIWFTNILLYTFTKFKISTHITLATLTVSSIILFFGLGYLWLFLFLIPIMWARRTLKDHTLPELLAGFFIPAIIMLTALLIFGWPKIL